MVCPQEAQNPNRIETTESDQNYASWFGVLCVNTTALQTKFDRYIRDGRCRGRLAARTLKRDGRSTCLDRRRELGAVRLADSNEWDRDMLPPAAAVVDDTYHSIPHIPHIRR